ncbi:MAG: glycosyltransferase family 39 protein [Anaerolineae bacterium]
MRRRALFRHGILLLLVSVAVIAQSWMLPALEGGDEVLHLNYVYRLLAGEWLPDRSSAATNATQQASGQPPLAYLFAAAWGRLIGLSPLDGDAILSHSVSQHNPWHFPHDPWASTDNHSIYIHGVNDRTGVEEAAFGWPELAAQNHLLRLAGLFWAILGVEGALLAARQLFRRESWTLTAALLFGLMPTFIYLAATVTNDAAVTALGAWATWAILRILRRGATPWVCLLAGLLIALAGLAKVSALLLGPAAIMAILLAPNRPRLREMGRWIRWVVLRGLALALPVGLLIGPWVAWGWFTYGDPFGFATHQYQTPGLYFATAQPISAVVLRLPQTAWSYFAQYNTVQPSITVMLALLAVPALSVVGGVLALRNHWSSFALRATIVLGLILLLTLIALVRWLGQFAITGGRLMYPAHAAVALVLAAGLYALWRRWPRLGRAAQAYAVVAVAVSSVVLGPLAIRSAFAAPARLDEASLPALTGGTVEFLESGEEAPFLRLLGAAFPSGNRIMGDKLPVTLCWEALAQPSREPAFSAKVILNGEIAADRTSLFGLGRYPSVLWQPGERWCDTFDMWMDDPDLVDEPPLRPGERYDLVVTVLDATTQASDFERTRNGQPVDAVVLGQVVSPAGTMSADALIPVSVEFPGLARVTGYRLDGPMSSSTSPVLVLGYEVTGEVQESWSTFIHLYRNGEFVGVLADGIPHAGRYPTTDWKRNEYVVDSWGLALPDELPQGDYTIRMGMYDPLTGVRRPAWVDGQRATDDSAELLAFTIP